MLSRRARLRLALAAALLLPPGAVLLYAVPPTPDSFYPRCPFHLLTGLHCPGCGSTRCLHALLHGRLLDALHCNALAILALPLLLAWALLRGWWLLRGGPLTGRPLHAGLVWGLAVVV